MWDESKKRFPVGGRVRGTVTEHQPFGIFVDIDDPNVTGLVQITDFLDEGTMTPERYPAIGTSIDAIVLGHKERPSNQIWLGVKPSQLRCQQ